jgi:hypothetical protein
VGITQRSPVVNTLLKFATFSLCTAVLARADVVMEQKLESPFISGSVVTKVKGDRARVDVPAAEVGQTTMLVDLKAGQMTTLVHAKKFLIKTDLAQAKAALEEQQKASGVDLSKIQPKATGEKEKVGEWECEIFKLDLGNGTSSKLWVAKGYPNYKGITDQLNKFNSAGAVAMGLDSLKGDLGGMTIKTEVTMPLGKLVSTLVSAKEEAVPDSEFEVPAGYEEKK